jgi:hypothetical protein
MIHLAQKNYKYQFASVSKNTVIGNIQQQSRNEIQK